MAAKKTTGLSDKEIEKIRKALGGGDNYQSQAFDRARQARKEKGISAAIKTFGETRKAERIVKTGRKTSRGDFFRGAGFDTLGDIVEKMFDKKASKEEIADAKKSLGIKEQKMGGAGFSMSTSKQLLKRLQVIESSIAAIRNDVSFIRDRVSPKQIEAGKGKDRQSYQYDPMAPHGEQVRQYTASGKLSAIKASKGAEKSVLMSAAMLGGKLALREEERKKRTGTVKRFVDPTEKSPFDDDLKNALAGDPVTKLRIDMNRNFAKVFAMLGDMNRSGTDVIGLAKTAGMIWNIVKNLTPLGLAAIVTTALAKGIIGGVEKNADRGIENIVKDVTQKKGSEQDYQKAIEDALNSPSNTKEQKEYIKQKLLTSENLSEEEKAVVGRYFETKGKRDLGKANLKKWDDLEESLRGWLRKNFSSADRETQKTAKTAYADYFDSIKNADNAPPSLEQFVALAQANGAPSPIASPTATAPTPPTPTAQATQISTPTATQSTPASEPPMEEITVSSMRKPTTIGDTGFLSKPVKYVVSKVKDLIVKAAKLVGIDPGFMLAMGKQESGFDPNAIPYDKKTGKPLTSAKGLFQFTDATWKGMVSKYGEQYPQLFDGPMDPFANSIAGGLFARDNANILKKKGIPVTGTNLYAAHFLGPGGATKLLSADPSAAAVDVVGKDAADANKSIFYDKQGNPVTVQKVIDFLYKQVGSSADKFAAELNAEMAPTPLAAPPITSTGAASPARSSSGAALDNGSKQVTAGKEAASQGTTPVVVSAPATTPNSASKTPPQAVPSANPRSSEGSFNRALAKDYSHPTAFTTVGTV